MADSRGNPYLGPYSFDEKDSALFFGREKETRRLASMVMARRAVLLYARSGAGKTSLLRAGLKSRLAKEGKIHVLPFTRVGNNPAASTLVGSENPFVFNLLYFLFGERTLPGSHNRRLAQGMSILLERCKDESGRPHLLIIDQFEEIFTAQGHWDAERRDLFTQLQETLEAFPNLSLLLSAREEFLARLDPFTPQLPGRLRSRFRLDLLREDGARRAIAEPARSAGGALTDKALESLLLDLRTLQVGPVASGADKKVSDVVEPAQLQVYCYRLWSKTSAGWGENPEPIGQDSLDQLGSVDNALQDHYAEQMERIARRRRIGERTLREWISGRLISQGGHRLPVLLEETSEIDPRVIQDLTAAHLVYLQNRREKTWIELAHDRLAPIIQEDNAEWSSTHLNPIELQAVSWDQRGRRNVDLPRGLARDEALEWAETADGERTPVEADFLEACRRVEASSKRLLTWKLLALGALIALLAWGTVTRLNDLKLRRGVAAGRLAAEALLAEPDPERLDLLLAAVSLDLAPNPQGRKILLEGLNGKILAYPLGPLPPLESLHFAAQDLVLAGLGGDGVRLWEDWGKPVTLFLPTGVGGFPEPRALALGPKGEILAMVDTQNELTLWWPGQDEGPKPLHPFQDPPTALTFANDGNLLAVASGQAEAQRIHLWNLEEDIKEELESTATDPLAPILSLAIGPRQRWVASGHANGSIYLWSRLPKSPGTLIADENRHAILDLAFDDEGKLLYAVTSGGSVFRWSIDRESIRELPLFKHETGTEAAALSRDLSTVAWIRQGKIEIIDLPTLQTLGELLAPNGWRPLTLSLAAQGQALAAVDSQGRALVWNLDPEHWKALACQEAGRDLTTEEWRSYLTFKDFRIPYRTPCEDLQ